MIREVPPPASVSSKSSVKHKDNTTICCAELFRDLWSLIWKSRCRFVCMCRWRACQKWCVHVVHCVYYCSPSPIRAFGFGKLTWRHMTDELLPRVSKPPSFLCGGLTSLTTFGLEVWSQHKKLHSNTNLFPQRIYILVFVPWLTVALVEPQTTAIQKIPMAGARDSLMTAFILWQTYLCAMCISNMIWVDEGCSLFLNIITGGELTDTRLILNFELVGMFTCRLYAFKAKCGLSCTHGHPLFAEYTRHIQELK